MQTKASPAALIITLAQVCAQLTAHGQLLHLIHPGVLSPSSKSEEKKPEPTAAAAAHAGLFRCPASCASSGASSRCTCTQRQQANGKTCSCKCTVLAAERLRAEPAAPYARHCRDGESCTTRAPHEPSSQKLMSSAQLNHCAYSMPCGLRQAQQALAAAHT